MVDRVKLAKEITDFLERHSIPSADYDPDFDNFEDRFNGPDSAMLYNAAEALKADVEFTRPLSSYGSGCYRPWPSKEVEAWHDRLLSQLSEYLSEHYPSNKHVR